MPSETGFLPKDFIETAEGLYFAVVHGLPEDGRLLCTLRYAPGDNGRLRKLGTADAHAYLRDHRPDYLRHSQRLDTELPAVPVERVVRHVRPRDRVQTLLAGHACDSIEDKACRLLGLFAAEGLYLAEFGLTGSLLIGAQTPASDIDLVIYDLSTFDAARSVVAKAMTDGRLSAPSEADWRESYVRRGCTLGFDDYLWHERRKFNSGLIEGTKFDLALVLLALTEPDQAAAKRGPMTLCATVTDDRRAFEYPARYRTDHPRVGEILSFTHTYVGQARTGEKIEASGLIEALADGRERLIVGSSREAPGEYIRVLHDDTSDPAIAELRAAILDMDGLAIDTEATYVAAWRGAASEMGFELDEAFCQSLFGYHADAVRQRIGENTGPGLDLDRFDAIAARVWHQHVAAHGIALMPGLEALLNFFRERNLPYALATNSEARFAAICLERSGAAHLFPVIVTRDQVSQGKPAPDLYLEAARRLGLAPEHCLALEDSEAGIEAAARAGTFAVLVNGRRPGSPHALRLARMQLRSLHQITALLRVSGVNAEAYPKRATLI